MLLLGQILSKPAFWHSAHAHLRVLGVLLIIGTLLVWGITSLLMSGNSRALKQAAYYQLAIITVATVVAGIFRLSTQTIDHMTLREGESTNLPDIGDANLGAFVFWLLLIVFGSLINLLLFVIRVVVDQRLKSN